MTAGRRPSGQPIIALLALIVGWTAARTMSWDESALALSYAPPPTGIQLSDPGTAASGPYFADPVAGPQSRVAVPREQPQRQPEAVQYVELGGVRYLLVPQAAVQPSLPAYQPESVARGRPQPALRTRGGLRSALRDWSLSFLGARSNAPEFPALPGGVRERFMALAGQPGEGDMPAGSAARAASPVSPPGRSRHWSADAWALIRKNDGQALPGGALPASYGASQAGAVLRYRLDRDSSRRPTAYLRTTSTIGATQEVSAALGLAARPVAGVPVTASIEGRLVDQSGSRRFQPAIMAVTEIAPFPLPLGLRGETYAQGGYVGGKYATPFADGQLRIDHALLHLGKFDARVGAGLWGGAQKGAGRLDAGPGATISMPLGHNLYGRMAFDWRFRIAGKARPGSGPALTLSAGF